YDTERRRLSMPVEGLLIPDRLAEALHLRNGARVAADPYVRGKDDVTLSIRAVAEQYLGLTAYADRSYLSRVLGEPDMVNGALVSVERGRLQDVIEELDDVAAISAVVANRQIIQGFRETVESMTGVMTFVLSCFAGVIAFAVIYNSSTINISERERELASLRAQGLGTEEVARIGTNDILPLGVLGILLGLPLGKLACVGMAEFYETDLYKVPAVTYPRTYVLAVALVVAFLLISRHICKKKVARIDIIRVLKTRE
ncbi:unnamed protein product, partial [marine sediment metagenome]